MTIKATINYWRAAGLTPDEAMAGLGVKRPLESTWAEVEVVAEMKARGLGSPQISADTASIAQQPARLPQPASNTTRRRNRKMAA